MHCHLLVPFREADAGSGYPSLSALLRFARCEGQQQADAAEWLCDRFGVVAQQDVPVAPFAALGDGLAAESGYWLCADPVSLMLQRDSFALAEPTDALQLTQARQLADALNAHFEADGMRFFVAAPRRWYLRLAQKPNLRTHPLAAMLHRDIQPFLPTGADGLHWHRLLNELQMLLHAHPVNAELEEQGVPPVNSVWPWGGGELVRGKSPGFQVWTDDALPRGLALAHAGGCSPLPATAQDWLGKAEKGAEHLVVLPGLTSQLERDWLAPLLEAVRGGNLALSVHLAGKQVQSYSLARRDFLKFWRRTRPLEHYLG